MFSFCRQLHPVRHGVSFAAVLFLLVWGVMVVVVGLFDDVRLGPKQHLNLLVDLRAWLTVF